MRGVGSLPVHRLGGWLWRASESPWLASVPSTTLTFVAARWAHQNRELRAVRAFKLGLAPIVVALLIATGWILASSAGNPLQQWRPWLLTAITTILVWRTRLHMLWLLGAGAALGAMGYL